MDASARPNARGSFGDRGKSSLAGTLGVGVGIMAVIYALSPGARHWYKHGRLPEAETTARWHAK